jgi:hypothetical protein
VGDLTVLRDMYTAGAERASQLLGNYREIAAHNTLGNIHELSLIHRQQVESTQLECTQIAPVDMDACDEDNDREDSECAVNMVSSLKHPASDLQSIPPDNLSIPISNPLKRKMSSSVEGTESGTEDEEKYLKRGRVEGRDIDSDSTSEGCDYASPSPDDNIDNDCEKIKEDEEVKSGVDGAMSERQDEGGATQDARIIDLMLADERPTEGTPEEEESERESTRVREWLTREQKAGALSVVDGDLKTAVGGITSSSSQDSIASVY